ncbi:type III polyketide synthase [Sphingomonas ginkgonis]|uniref:Type III polyketide synthase n=1 Tax=Sphingomonas ginkgonis TaxID=2315330 RepID=A0A3S0EPP3_9SPHN|nr:type III polyketide synthase [Sphingomonas ginkgonis]RST32229.1 type III polyketide synthase [Sphingomonas ginkgonis]
MSERAAFINQVTTAVPSQDVHKAFLAWAEQRLPDERQRSVFRRMAERSGINHRWSVLPTTAGGGSPVADGGLYADAPPPTSERMRIYAETAPELALAAIAKLDAGAIARTTHLVVASCTGFVAPGVDQIIARRLGLANHVERTLIGFMGCYAAIAALRTAYHIVRSEPAARVLVVTVELSTLHLQFTDDMEALLGMLQFGDGAAAAIVSADATGLRIDRPFAIAMEDSETLIQWAIGETGFVMQLSGEVPGRIGSALEKPWIRERILDAVDAGKIDSWAVHAGGRSILDAVQRGFDLPANALDRSREVLADFGNMSSSTLMFVLAAILRQSDEGERSGVALAFGPGLAAEGFRYERAA